MRSDMSLGAGEPLGDTLRGHRHAEPSSTPPLVIEGPYEPCTHCHTVHCRPFPLGWLATERFWAHRRRCLWVLAKIMYFGDRLVEARRQRRHGLRLAPNDPQPHAAVRRTQEQQYN